MAGFQVIMYGRFWVFTEVLVRARFSDQLSVFGPQLPTSLNRATSEQFLRGLTCKVGR